MYEDCCDCCYCRSQRGASSVGYDWQDLAESAQAELDRMIALKLERYIVLIGDHNGSEIKRKAGSLDLAISYGRREIVGDYELYFSVYDLTEMKEVFAEDYARAKLALENEKVTRMAKGLRICCGETPSFKCESIFNPIVYKIECQNCHRNVFTKNKQPKRAFDIWNSEEFARL